MHVPVGPPFCLPWLRYLGIVVCRGTAVMTIMPYEGTEEIQNPFVTAEQA